MQLKIELANGIIGTQVATVRRIFAALASLVACQIKDFRILTAAPGARVTCNKYDNSATNYDQTVALCNNKEPKETRLWASRYKRE